MKVAVLGAGTMGRGITQITAMADHEVAVRAAEEPYVEEGLAAVRSTLETGVEYGKVDPETAEATVERIRGTTSLPDALEGAELVIEAVPKDLDLKHEVLSEVEASVGDDVALASNTSSLSLTAIASVLDRPERAIGTHFFNPPHLMELVEVVLAEQTDEETRWFTTSFVRDVDQTPVVVEDSPGFASSRLGVVLGVEAMRMVREGVASPRDIDTAMELGYNHPMGPLKLTDVVGLDVRLDILEYLREELGERFRPPQVLKRRVQAGKLGKKTGEGFYVWEDGEAVGVSEDFDGAQ